MYTIKKFEFRVVTFELNQTILTYIDCPDKMKLAFGIATVKTIDP